jgi:predicted peroxiredoxin
MATMAITVNGTSPNNVYPAFILGSAAIGLGDKVVLFFTPAGAPALVKGEMEKIQDVKGNPNLIELYNDFTKLGGKVVVCENALSAKDLKKKDFRKRVIITGATTFLGEVENATITFSF